MAGIAGKVTIILGAGTDGNMGQVIARRFAQEGAKVMVSGRNPAVLESLARELGCTWTCCDITQDRDNRALVEATVQHYGRLDVAINTTGFNVMKPFLETTREDLERVTAVQFTGPFQFMQAVVRVMATGGSIIQVSSATATIMLDNHAAYMGTKAGTDHVIRCIANEFGERGIRANILAPGLTNTPMAAMAFEHPAMVEAFRKEYPLGRIGTAEDIAAAAVWVASDECFMTGQTFQVNGGLTLRRNPRYSELMAAIGAK